MSTRRIFIRLVGATVIGVPLTGCTGDREPENTSNPTTDTTTSESTTTTDTTTSSTTEEETTTTEELDHPQIENTELEGSGMSVVPTNGGGRAGISVSLNNAGHVVNASMRYLMDDYDAGIESEFLEDDQQVAANIDRQGIPPGGFPVAVDYVLENDEPGEIEITVESPEFPVKMDNQERDNYSTDRPFDDLTPLSDEEAVEMYWTNIQGMEENTNMATYDEIRPVVRRVFNELDDSLRWTQKLGYASGIGIAETDDGSLTGSGGFVGPLTTSIRNFATELEDISDGQYSNRDREDFLCFYILATNDGYVNHEQVIMIDEQENRTDLGKPIIDEYDQPEGAFRELSETDYADPEKTEWALGFDGRKLEQQDENGRIHNHDYVDLHMYGSHLTIVDQTTWNLPDTMPGVAFSEEYKDWISPRARELDGEFIRYLQENVVEPLIGYAEGGIEFEEENVAIHYNEESETPEIYGNLSDEDRNGIMRGEIRLEDIKEGLEPA